MAPEEIFFQVESLNGEFLVFNSILHLFPLMYPKFLSTYESSSDPDPQDSFFEPVVLITTVS